MNVPVTDAFDDTDQLKSLEVTLTAEQIEWLRENAEERNLSLDHMLRSVITAQMRSRSASDAPPVPSISGDGQPPSSSDADDEASDDGPSSIVESLRSASERLQNLTDREQVGETETPDPSDALERLQAHLNDSSDVEEEAPDEDEESFVVENQDRSMFDMIDED
jgi:hypothetical protein